MGRIVLSIILGCLSPFVFILGAEPFEVRGKSSFQEILAGCIAIGLYLAVCQFFVARKGEFGLRTKWIILAAMDAPLLAASIVILVLENGSVFFAQAVPMLLAGCAGSFAGAIAAARGTTRPQSNDAKV
jgi:hypothetical protein